MIKYKEEWIIRCDNQDFITSKPGKDKIVHAMQQNKRFVSLSEKEIISVRHISYIYMSSRQITNQLQEGNKKREVFIPVSKKKMNEIRDKAYRNIGRPVSKKQKQIKT